MTSAEPKADKAARVAEAVLKLVAQGGVESVRYSKLARAAGVSRAWIYKFAPKRDELLLFAVDHFGRIFTSLDEPHPRFLSREDWLDASARRFARLLADAERRPMVVQLYFRFRGTPTLAGKRIAEVERLEGHREGQALGELFGIPKEKVELASELIGGMRMGLAHAWSCGVLSQLTSSEALTATFRQVVDRMLADLTARP